MLHQAGHGTEVARRYPAVLFRDVSQRLHVPRRLTEPERLAWIDRVGAARGIETPYETMKTEIEAAASDRHGANDRVLRAIKRLYEWKQEMLDGPGRHTSG
ncbi:MAG: hypothetical protein GKS00_00875 [Alphaproteobacteria bacterium]|nr:hypothetical protein [Alphaproteobacteria bacterium]